MKLSIKKFGDFLFQRGHRDESGAVALLCLAAIIALMTMTWMIVDTGEAVQDKLKLQGAVDTAAFSHAAVEARSMNMIAYSNISKRSIVGMHSLYPAMFASYTTWILGHLGICIGSLGTKADSCAKVIANVPLWVVEASNDHVAYSGDPFTPYIDAVAQGINEMISKLSDKINKYNDIAEWVPGLPEIPFELPTAGAQGNSQNAHLPDIAALDNYQRYMMHITPWWAWSEQLSRGWRNGATTVASFPPPPGDINNLLTSVDSVIQKANAILGSLNMGNIDAPDLAHGYDGLPISHQNYDMFDWGCHMLIGNSSCTLDIDSFDFESLAKNGNWPFYIEHVLNTALFVKESNIPLADGLDQVAIFGAGSTMFFATVGVLYSNSVFGQASSPYDIDGGGSEGEWLKRTSNLVFAYLNKPERMQENRNKYNVIETSYSHSGLGSVIGEHIYKSSGYWTMAKSEITFNGEGWEPDMWHPSWTARMRPVHLPSEFEQGNFRMFDAYRHSVPYLALSAQVGSIQGGQSLDNIMSSVEDIAVMGASTAAMGPSTADGITK